MALFKQTVMVAPAIGRPLAPKAMSSLREPCARADDTFANSTQIRIAYAPAYRNANVETVVRREPRPEQMSARRATAFLGKFVIAVISSPLIIGSFNTAGELLCTERGAYGNSPAQL